MKVLAKMKLYIHQFQYVYKYFRVDKMHRSLDRNSFQIILKLDGKEDLSSDWQNQCQYLYNEMYMALPEGSIKPLILERTSEKKVETITLFSVLTILFTEITAKIFVELVFEKIKNWSINTPNASIEIKCPDGSIAKIPEQLFPKVIKLFEENSHSSICEALNSLTNLAAD